MASHRHGPRPLAGALPSLSGGQLLRPSAVEGLGAGRRVLRGEGGVGRRGTPPAPGRRSTRPQCTGARGRRSDLRAPVTSLRPLPPRTVPSGRGWGPLNRSPVGLVAWNPTFLRRVTGAEGRGGSRRASHKTLLRCRRRKCR